MKKLLLAAFLLLSLHSFSYMQEVPLDSLWETKGSLNFNIQQVGFTNWANGGLPSLSYGSVLTYSANRKDDNSTWKNNFQAAFGFLKQDAQASKKNTDLLILTSEYGKKIGTNTQVTIGTDMRSQFAKGYTYSKDPNTGDEIATLVSAFLSPGYIQTAIGIGYKKGKKFSATASPLTSKLTIVMDQSLSNAGAYGVEVGKTIRSQVGASLNAAYVNEIIENVILKTNLMLFGDYKKISRWDVNYDLFLDFKVNEYITTNFLLQAIYDHDIKGNSDKEGVTGPAMQLRNVLNIGLTFKL